MIRITDIKLDVRKASSLLSEKENLLKYLYNQYHIIDKEIQSFTIFKKAIDARKKEQLYFVYSVDLEITNEKKYVDKKVKGLTIAPVLTYQEITSGDQMLTHPPIIVGFGPSGMFAALLLARRGYRPIVLERGYDVDQRSTNVERFYKTGVYHEGSTILFGEGGAGTFSDGKLTTLISDIRCRYILNALIEHGAQPEILYINKPHVGTDVLKIVVKNIREEIIRLGGEIRFNAKVTKLIVKDNKLQGVMINDEEELLSSVCLLGIGHSARDTFELLYNERVNIIQKAFSVGVRIEHPQLLINQAQYGKFANEPYLGAADYKMSYHGSDKRSAYTFCMCPGGWVMCASSEEGGVVTNGMSESKRDYENSNAALLVNVNPSDFGSDHPLAGVSYQRKIEQKAFVLGGSNYNAPIQLVGDFLKDQPSTKLGSVNPSYRPGYKFAELKALFPAYVTQTLREALRDFNRKIQGFSIDDAILTGPETRSSSPIRMTRDEYHESNIKGLYPMGEGAGYAGGIMSSAVDGMKTAEKIIVMYQPVDQNGKTY
ncbi:hypothetical protein BK010_09220 [Tenericutes bacterium MO-XQ]|nr:hypothetical protein BK010_09220 [Tenericutes bacterium MO-XQ]